MVSEFAPEPPDPKPVVRVNASPLTYAPAFVPAERFVLSRHRGGCVVRSDTAVVAYIRREPLWRPGTRRFVIAFVLSCVLFGGTMIAALGPYPMINTPARVCLPLTLLLAGVLAWKLSSRAIEFRPADTDVPILRLIPRDRLGRTSFDVVPASAASGAAPAAVIVEVGGIARRRWSLQTPESFTGSARVLRLRDVLGAADSAPELASFVTTQVISGVAAPVQELRLFNSPDVRGRLVSRAFQGVELSLNFRPEDEPRLCRDHLLLLAFLSAWNGG